MSDSSTYIVYDGECPFCSRHVKFMRLRKAAGPVTLVNARDSRHPVVHFVGPAARRAKAASATMRPSSRARPDD